MLSRVGVGLGWVGVGLQTGFKDQLRLIKVHENWFVAHSVHIVPKKVVLFILLEAEWDLGLMCPPGPSCEENMLPLVGLKAFPFVFLIFTNPTLYLACKFSP